MQLSTSMRECLLDSVEELVDGGISHFTMDRIILMLLGVHVSELDETTIRELEDRFFVCASCENLYPSEELEKEEPTTCHQCCEEEE